MSSSFIHVVTKARIILCTHHIFFIHSSVDGHSGFFHLLAIVKYTIFNWEILNNLRSMSLNFFKIAIVLIFLFPNVSVFVYRRFIIIIIFIIIITFIDWYLCLNAFLSFFFFFFFFGCEECKILFPSLGTEPLPTVVEAQSFNHRAAREGPVCFFVFFPLTGDSFKVKF